ncbi:MAG: hypothetical protein AAB874_05500 [Patescibacteria group bacterium]
MAMADLFDAPIFIFPYSDIRFPGQASDERILYVAREAKVMRFLRSVFVLLAAAMLLIVSQIVLGILTQMANVELGLWQVVLFAVGIVFGAVGLWWVNTTWQKSVFIITNRRLTKFIYVTPWNRYNLSVTLDMIEDTGAYSRGYFEALVKIGTFTARSAAGNREEKYFFVDHVEYAEDLANYVNKVLFMFKNDVAKLDTFRPFITEKGAAREHFIKEHPEFTN